MKIGTKANSIDDLGKFDGSKMTIKVNGKQIYPQKRYAIVRVDYKCPQDLEEDIKKIRFSIDDVRDNKRVYFQNSAIYLCCKLSRVDIAIEDKEIDF